MLPNLLFSLFVGHWVEGRRHRRIMIPADVVRAVLLAIIPVAAFGGWLSVPLLVVVAFLTGVAGVFFEIAGFAFVPSMVDTDDLAAANRAVQGSSTVAQVAGPGLAGLLIQTVGPPLALVVDAVSYLASGLGIAVGRPRRTAATPEAVPVERRAAVTEGLRLLVGNLYLRALTLHAAVYNLAAQVFTINLMLWAVQERQVSPGGYGLALSAGGVGAVLGTLTALRLADRLGFGRAFAASLLVVLLHSTHCDRPAVVRDCTGGRNRRRAARLRRRARQRQRLLPHAAADRHSRRPTSPHRWRLPPDHVRIHPYRQRPGRCSRGDGRHPGRCRVRHDRLSSVSRTHARPPHPSAA